MVKRRKFVIMPGAGALAAPLASFAKQQGTLWRIGLLRAAGCAWATVVLLSLPQPVMAQGSYGLFAPTRTPAAIVQTLHQGVARLVSVPDVRDRLVAGGYTIVASTPEQFSERVKREVEKFRKIILDSGMQQE